MKRSKMLLPRLLASALMLGALSLGPGGTPAARVQPPVTALRLLPAGADSAPEINTFLEEDRRQMPPTGAVLFMGSSSVRLWTTLAQDFSEIPVINRGFGGTLIADNTLYVNRIAIPYKPKIIVL